MDVYTNRPGGARPASLQRVSVSWRTPANCRHTLRLRAIVVTQYPGVDLVPPKSVRQSDRESNEAHAPSGFDAHRGEPDTPSGRSGSAWRHSHWPRFQCPQLRTAAAPEGLVPGELPGQSKAPAPQGRGYALLPKRPRGNGPTSTAPRTPRKKPSEAIFERPPEHPASPSPGHDGSTLYPVSPSRRTGRRHTIALEPVPLRGLFARR